MIDPHAPSSEIIKGSISFVSGQKSILLEDASEASWRDTLLFHLTRKIVAEKTAHRKATKNFITATSACYNPKVMAYAFSEKEQQQHLKAGAPLRVETVRKVLAKAEGVIAESKLYVLEHPTLPLSIATALGIARYAQREADRAAHAFVNVGNPQEHLEYVVLHALSASGKTTLIVGSAVILVVGPHYVATTPTIVLKILKGVSGVIPYLLAPTVTDNISSSFSEASLFSAAQAVEMTAGETQSEANTLHQRAVTAAQRLVTLAHDNFNQTLHQVDQWNAKNPKNRYPMNPYYSNNDFLDVRGKNEAFLKTCHLLEQTQREVEAAALLPASQAKLQSTLPPPWRRGI